MFMFTLFVQPNMPFPQQIPQTFSLLECQTSYFLKLPLSTTICPVDGHKETTRRILTHPIHLCAVHGIQRLYKHK